MTATLPEPTVAQLNVARQMRAYCRRRPWDGRVLTMAACRAVRQVPAATDPELRTNLLLTLDKGYHASGWWRNAEYDTCWHLSLSWPTPDGRAMSYLDMPRAEVDFWARLFFGEFARWVWHEPGGADVPGRSMAHRQAHKPINHLRLFLDRHTHRPILPTGEVYELTRWDPDTPAKVDR